MTAQAHRHRHPSPEDEALRLEVEAALAILALEAVTVYAEDGVVYLSGRVGAAHLRREAEARARSAPGVRRVVNELQVVAIDDVQPPLLAAQDNTDVDALEEPIPREREGPEPSFTDDIGAGSVAESVDEAEPYFPPTDTVVKPRPREQEGLEWVGGFAPTAETPPLEQDKHPIRFQREDDEIAEDVRLALEEDAMTSDLDIHVYVRKGIVYLRGTVSTIEEVEAAEAVAARVPGVVEVQEELTLA